MFKVFFLCLILVYFYSFYYISSKPLVPPSHAADVSRKFDPLFRARSQHSFEFVLRNKAMWQHDFPDNTYLVKADTRQIIERDDCFNHPDPVHISATGLNLYKYLKKHPEYQQSVQFEEDSIYTAQQGNVFYFSCVDRHIEKLHMCPSGKVFQNQVCVDISSCTGQPDDTYLPVLSDPTRFIQCKNGREFFKSCPPNTFFYYDQCVDKDDKAFLCKWDKTTHPTKLDATTLFECQNFKPVYTTCPAGTRMFGDSLVCEPDDCWHVPDGTQLPLRPRVQEPFRFTSGYMTCFEDKISQVVECPAVWDATLSQGDDVTHLPMVFDGQACGVPIFGQNVFSDDPEVLVPVHEFNKHVQNWLQSPLYDQAAGYTVGRKRKSLDPGMRIGKHFKVESACPPGHPLYLPIDGALDRFYDCIHQQVETCPPGEFFNGQQCRERPEHAFEFRNLPLFRFDALNAENWMNPWEYLAKQESLKGCQSAEYRYFPLYNVCAHPACEKAAFLSMIPEMTLLLPQEQQAKCTFDEATRHVTQTPVNMGYTFWDQKILPENVNTPEVCRFGQTLKTGHFMWDRTLFATCDLAQPFIFCPSVHSRGLIRDGNVYACAPPPGNRLHHPYVHQWRGYSRNEVKRILPPVWDGVPYKFLLNRKDQVLRDLPETGFEIPKNETVNLWVDRPVDLELRYRVTFPPNAAFEYDDQNQQRMLSHPDPNHAFHVRSEKFTHLGMQFPKFSAEEFVPLFIKNYVP